jgi:hypothetical protein
MKPWVRRLKVIEARASFLCVDEKLDRWIKANMGDSEFSYWDIMKQVPDHLKLACVDRALEQIRSFRVPFQEL